MRRFFVDKADKPILKLTGDERKHLAEVLRARQGDKIVVCPNDGNDYIYEIVSFDKTSVTLNFIEQYVNPTEPDLFLCVYIALLKGDKTELEVQKLTELGVKKIVPFVCERTVKNTEKTERLLRAAHEASKQCGRAIIPEISEVKNFKEIISELSQYDSSVFAYEGAYGGGYRLGDIVSGNEKSIALVIGPEGGFSDDEVNIALETGIKSVTLGKRILRAETAAIAGTAVIMQLCGEWK